MRRKTRFTVSMECLINFPPFRKLGNLESTNHPIITELSQLRSRLTSSAWERFGRGKARSSWRDHGPKIVHLTLKKLFRDPLMIPSVCRVKPHKFPSHTRTQTTCYILHVLYLAVSIHLSADQTVIKPNTFNSKLGTIGYNPFQHSIMNTNIIYFSTAHLFDHNWKVLSNNNTFTYSIQQDHSHQYFRSKRLL